MEASRGPRASGKARGLPTQGKVEWQELPGREASTRIISREGMRGVGRAPRLAVEESRAGSTDVGSGRPEQAPGPCAGRGGMLSRLNKGHAHIHSTVCNPYKTAPGHATRGRELHRGRGRGGVSISRRTPQFAANKNVQRRMRPLFLVNQKKKPTKRSGTKKVSAEASAAVRKVVHKLGHGGCGTNWPDT